MLACFAFKYSFCTSFVHSSITIYNPCTRVRAFFASARVFGAWLNLIPSLSLSLSRVFRLLCTLLLFLSLSFLHLTHSFSRTRILSFGLPHYLYPERAHEFNILTECLTAHGHACSHVYVFRACTEYLPCEGTRTCVIYPRGALHRPTLY